MSDRQLPPGWSILPLGELGSWGSGGTPKKSRPEYYGGQIPWLVIGDLNDAHVLSAKNNITVEGLNNSSAKLVPKNTLLIAMYGSIGKLGITAIECATNQAIAWCKVNADSVDLKYLFYLLMGRREHLLSQGKGGAQQNISQTVLKSYEVPIAPRAEQTRIAQKLDQLLAQVDIIKNRVDAIPGITKRFRQSVLAAAVSGKLTEDWRGENDGHFARLEPIESYWRAEYVKHGKKYKPPAENALRRGNIGIPESWIATNIGSVFDVHVGATPSRSEPNFWGGEIPWVSSSEVCFCRITDTKEKITEAGLDNTSTSVHPAGTVMLAMIGQGKTRGQPAILSTAACHNQNTAALRVPEPYCSSEFLYYYLWEQYEKTREIGGGNNQKALNKSTVQDLKFPLPPVEEQYEIVRRVDSLFAFADQIERQISLASSSVNSFTQSILAKAFRGELVPQHTNAEPARLMLEKLPERK